jgi:hypothetical protein
MTSGEWVHVLIATCMRDELVQEPAGVLQFWFVIIVVACPSCTNKF